jgi:hypothetical protein
VRNSLTLLLFCVFACFAYGQEEVFFVIDKDDASLAEYYDTLIKIEKQYGPQWDFCTCIRKNDSLNKSLRDALLDEEFDKLLERADFVEFKCQAFLVINVDNTPEDRVRHKKRVEECLIPSEAK